MKRVVFILAAVIAVAAITGGSIAAAGGDNGAAGAVETHDAVNVSVDAGDNGGEVTLAVGDLLIVTLESNPTTGYGWSLAGAGEPGVIAVKGNEFIAPESTEPLVGQGGVEVWTFQAVAAGEVTIAMEYVRPWEQGVEPEAEFNINVVVE